MRRKKILVVDDEEHLLRGMHWLLEGIGYDVVDVERPDRLVEVASQEHPDLILQDVNIVGIDLPSLVRTLRRNAATREIPFILFTAGPTPEPGKPKEGDAYRWGRRPEDEVYSAVRGAFRMREDIGEVKE